MFGAGEEPAAELFAVERGGGAVEGGVGLAVWGEEEIGFVASEAGGYRRPRVSGVLCCVVA